MTKQKKSRKVGVIGVRKNPDHVHTTSSGRVKKRKGKSPGNRNNVESTTTKTSIKQAKQDPRHGSTKPVPLIKSAAPLVKTQTRKYATPAEELASIESNGRLMSLLDKIEQNKALTKEQQEFVDAQMARHKTLCELMGIKEETENSDSPEIEDEFASLDAFSLDDFKE